MSKIPSILQNLLIPVIGSPLFIISNPKLVIEQCKAGIVGSMPALNARPASILDEWLAEIQRSSQLIMQKIQSSSCPICY